MWTQRIETATKRVFNAAKRSGKPISWHDARRLGVLWCAKMWPRQFEEHPWIEWRGSLHYLKAAS
jgi:hypothetical protein